MEILRLSPTDPLFTPQPEFRPYSLLRANDVAEILNISISLAYKLLKAKKIPSVRFYRSVRVKPKDLIEFIEKSKSG